MQRNVVKVDVEFGNQDSGSTRYATKKTWKDVSTTSIGIQENMVSYRESLIGPIQAFIGLSKQDNTSVIGAVLSHRR